MKLTRSAAIGFSVTALAALGVPLAAQAGVTNGGARNSAGRPPSMAMYNFRNSRGGPKTSSSPVTAPATYKLASSFIERLDGHRDRRALRGQLRAELRERQMDASERGRGSLAQRGG